MIRLGPLPTVATVTALALAAVLAGRYVPRAADEADARTGAVTSLVVAAVLATGAARMTRRRTANGG